MIVHYFNLHVCTLIWVCWVIWPAAQIQYFIIGGELIAKKGYLSGWLISLFVMFWHLYNKVLIIFKFILLLKRKLNLIGCYFTSFKITKICINIIIFWSDGWLCLCSCKTVTCICKLLLNIISFKHFHFTATCMYHVMSMKIICYFIVPRTHPSASWHGRSNHWRKSWEKGIFNLPPWQPRWRS